MSDGSIEEEEEQNEGKLIKSYSLSSNFNSMINNDDKVQECYKTLIKRRRKKDSQKLRQSVETELNPITKKNKSESDAQKLDLDSENNSFQNLNKDQNQYSTPKKYKSQDQQYESEKNIQIQQQENSIKKSSKPLLNQSTQNSAQKQQQQKINNDNNNNKNNDNDNINKNDKQTITNKKIDEKQNIKQIEKLNKQISTNFNLETLDISMLSKTFSENKKVDANPIKITNQKIPEKQSAYQVLKNLLLYFFSDDGKNPLWMFVQSKQDIKNMIFLQVKIESGADFLNMIKQRKLDFLSQQYLHADKKVTDIKDNYCPIKNNFWLSVFGYLAPGKKIEQKIKEIDVNNILKSTSYNSLQSINNDNNTNNQQFIKQNSNNLINGESVDQRQSSLSNSENSDNGQNQNQNENDSNQNENESDKDQNILSNYDVKKYSTFVLTAEEQWNNLYPQQNKDGFKHYALSENSPLKIEDVENKNKILALDCEMVRTNKGCLELARVTLINYLGEKLIDDFVKPENPIVDYNTQYSGITPQLLENVKMNLAQMQEKILNYINPEILLIGHSLENDLNALQLIHRNVIDTSVLFLANGRKQSLKNLTKQYFNKYIQQTTHDSLEDALAALNLVKLAKVTYKNGIEMKSEKQINFNVIQSIKKANNSVMIMDNKENLDQLIQQGINFEEIGKSDESIDYKNILTKLIKIVKPERKNSQFVPNIIMTKIQKKKQEYQTQFCYNINTKIKELYNEVSEKTFMMIHFDIDNSKNKDNTKPFCLFFNK